LFLQAEDGIRDRNVTGVQTCALPICFAFHTGKLRSGQGRRRDVYSAGGRLDKSEARSFQGCSLGGQTCFIHALRKRRRPAPKGQIGRASCREGGQSKELLI